jgi:SAM-dependent methyltransferase
MSMTYDPELYDLVSGADVGGDIDWYRRKAQESGGPILELGAGTGRITLPIAQAGLAIHALDADRGMLAALKRKVDALPEAVQQCVTVIEGDMRSFQTDTRFALVIIPARAFLHNQTADDQLACLHRVNQHLQPGGQLAFNVFHPSLEYMAQHAGAFTGVWRWTATYQHSNGGSVLCSESTRYDTVRQRLQAYQRYEHCDAAGHVTRTFLHRLELAYLYPSDIVRLLEQSGFRDVHIGGGFGGQPFSNDGDELVVEATRV